MVQLYLACYLIDERKGKFNDKSFEDQREGRTRALDVSWGHACARTRVSYVS